MMIDIIKQSLEMSQLQKISQCIDKFKKYMDSKLSDQKYLNKIIFEHQAHLTDSEYSCLYCKEIIGILVLTQQFNCSIKPLKIEQLKCFDYILTPTADHIYILSILSEESTTQMKTHLQHMFLTTIDIQTQSYSIEDNYKTVTINQFDPILSKSKIHNGVYSYVKQIEKKNLTKEAIFKKINEDKMQSLPPDIIEFYNTRLSKMGRKKLREEVNKMFPFLNPAAVKFFSKSHTRLIYFLYCKTFIAPSFTILISESFQYQDYSRLKPIFTRLTDQDFNNLTNHETLEEQYSLFCQLTTEKEKGLNCDEFINLVIQEIETNSDDESSLDNLFDTLTQTDEYDEDWE